MQGTIFSIEEFAINDGPGIRTNIFMKGCPMRCVWCHNPEGISPEPQYLDKKEGRVLCGRKVGAEELAAQMLDNRDIFEMSSGGVTLTGGEPLFQPGFAREFLQRVKPLHTAIETSGYASEKVFREVTEASDLVLMDVKHTDPEKHKKYTGVDNGPILKNLEYLCAADTDFIVRIPLIPGVNDSRENMETVCKLIGNAKRLVRVELLRYHRTAGAKYRMAGLEYDPPFDTGREPEVHGVFEEHDIKTMLL